MQRVIQKLAAYLPLQQDEADDPEAAPGSNGSFSSFLANDGSSRQSNGIKSVQLAVTKLSHR